jgi:hypothetical protein
VVVFVVVDPLDRIARADLHGERSEAICLRDGHLMHPPLVVGAMPAVGLGADRAERGEHEDKD